MTFLLDTNVISEWVKPQPDPGVVSWLAEVDEDRTYLSVISLAEIRQGIELMPDGGRRTRLETWLVGDLPARFEGRILDIDREVAERWGTTMARARRTGRRLSTMDAFLVATAERHLLTLVTRNIKDFAVVGIPLLDPWRLNDPS